MPTTIQRDSESYGHFAEPAHGLASPVGNVKGAFGSFAFDTDSASQTHQLSLLVEVNAALAGTLEVESVLGPILSRLVEREHLSHARIYRVDGLAGNLHRVACEGALGPSPEVIAVDSLSLLAWTIRQREPVYVALAKEDPRCQDFGQLEQSAYAVPLQTGARVVGALEVATEHPEGIRCVTRKLIDQLATQAALALERSELYQKLRVSEERFRSIFEQVSFGVVLANLDGRFSAVNPAFARMLRSTGEDLAGKHFAEVTDPENVTAIEVCLRQLQNGDAHQVNFEKRYLRKSGSPVWCSTNITLLHDANGHPAYFLGMFQDVTERKAAEEERDRFQQQLFQAQKMEALGTLAGGIAHDFNNLLGVMLGFASLARQRLGADDPLQDSMGMIEESAHRAAELTRQLLGFARPESQQIKPVSVHDVLDRVRRMVERTFDRNITIEICEPGGPLWVKSEPSHLEQALLNLCINARDAMLAGGSLTIKAWPSTLNAQGEEAVAGHPYTSIAVKDSGSGIQPEVLTRIFDPFFTTKEAGRGTGLGLAMVYGFVKNHDGFIKVESATGNGSRFILSLPQIFPELPLPSSEVDRIEPGHGTVLVVDDEPLVRAFAVEGLKVLGYEVLVAENGREALQIYEQRSGKIDCVLLDLIMPDISGLETFRQLRTQDPEVRVVFASGYSTGGILRDAPDAREAAFIGKPYTLAGLSAAVRTAAAAKPSGE